MSSMTPELREFISAKFGSPEQLDVFVLLYRKREQDWSPVEVGSQLGTAPEAAGMRLYLLSSAGLVVSDGATDVRYRYASSPLIDAFAEAVASACESDRDSVYGIITGVTSADPVKQLADAFRLRK